MPAAKPAAKPPAPAPAAPAPAPAEHPEVSRAAAADAAVLADLAAADVIDAEPAPAPPAAQEPEPEPAAEPASVEPEPPPEPTDEDEERAEGKGLAYKVGQARRYKRQAEDALREAQQLSAQYEQQRAQLDAERQQVAAFKAIAEQAASGDVEAAIDALARRAGRSPDDLLTSYIRRKAGEPEQQPRTMPELVAMQKRLDAIEAERQQERQQVAQERAHYQLRTQVDDAVERIATVQSDQKLAAIWPHVAKLPPDLLRDSARNLVADAIARAPAGRQVSLDDIVATLEQYAWKLYAHYQQVPSVTGSNGKNSAGQGNPAVAKPAARHKASDHLTNELAAAASTGRRDKTREELYAEVDALAAAAAQEYLSDE